MSASTLSVRARLASAISRVISGIHDFRDLRSLELPRGQGKPAIEQLEERILFGVYIAYDYTLDPGPGNPSCATAGAAGGGTGAGANTGAGAGAALGGSGSGWEPSSPGSMNDLSRGPGKNPMAGPGLAGQQRLNGIQLASNTIAPVNDFTGMPVVTATDLSSDAFGGDWGVTRSWSGLNSQSLMGNGWSVIGTPYLEVSGPSTERRINVVVGGGDTYSFNVPSSSPYDNYTVIGAFDVSLQLVTGSPNILRFTDGDGNVTDFYDVYRVSGDPTPLASWDLSQKYGQLKDYISADGTTTTTTNYDSNGYLQSVTRSDSTTGASERMEYTYSTVTNSAVTTAGGTPPTLIGTVTLQRDVSGTWQDVQRALYTYYTGELSGGGADPNGRLGDLQMEQTQDLNGAIAPSASLAAGGSLPSSAQYYQVTAVLPDGESSPSSEIEITPTSGNGTVDLSWAAVSNATGYKIYRDSAAGGEQYLATASGTTYSDTGGTTTTAQPPMINAAYYRYDKFTDEANGQFTTLGPSNNENTTEGPAPYQESTQPDSLSEALVSSGLRTVVTGPSLAQLSANVSNYQTASDATIQPYVDHYFDYERWDDHVGEDGSPSYGAEPYNTNGISQTFRDAYQLGTRYRVTDEVASRSGCACTSGQGIYKYEYATNYDPLSYPYPSTGFGYAPGNIDYNTWRMKTTTFLQDPSTDWGVHNRDVVYTNVMGEPLLDDQVQVASSDFAVASMSAPTYTNSDGSVTITVDTGSANGFVTGDRVALSGVAPELFDGVFTVTVVNANEFTFNLSAAYTGLRSTNYAPQPYVDEPIHQQTSHGTTLYTTATLVLGETLTASRYDSQGRLIETSNPSAVTGYDDSQNDPTDKVISGTVTTDGWLSTNSGLIYKYNYGTTTTAGTTTAGDVVGLLKSESMQQGTSAVNTALIGSLDYYQHSDSSGIVVYPVADSTAYRNADGTGAETTHYDYGWYSNTNAIHTITTTLPVISSAQNGSGVSDVTKVALDQFGRTIWTMDGDGRVNYTEYDPLGTGGIVEQINDVNYNDLSFNQQSSFNATQWTAPSAGLNLATYYTVDLQGRTTSQTTPNGNVTYTLYNDANHDTRTYPGFNGTTTTGPITVSRQYWPLPGSGDFYYTETLTTSATPNLTNGVPDGTESINASNITSLQRQFMNDAGQLIWSDSYFNFSGLTYSQAVGADGNGNPADIGASGANYYRTTFGYDHRGRPDETIEPTGTIDITVFDSLGRVSSKWVGTDATPTTGYWSPTNTAGANMMDVEDDVYDGGGVGDSNLTQVTTHPGLAQPDRVIQFLYDWRDRQVAAKDGVQATETDGAHRPITYTVYDNLNEPTANYQYDGDGIPLSDFASTAINDSAPTADSSALRAKSTSAYDDQGRVYQQQTFSVDQSNGVIGNSLTTNTFYDHRGNAIAVFSPGGQVTKSVYDGAGRLSSQYVTDGGAVNNGGVQQLDWMHAGSVSSDVVLKENDYTYDGDGNVILTLTRDRFDNDASTATGALGSPSTGVGARVYYVADYYDAADRQVTEVNAGTNGGAAWTRPSSNADPSISRSSTSAVLRTDYAYDVAGNQYLITDPRGIMTQYNFDLLGRRNQEIDDSTGGSPATGMNVTDYTYDGDNNILTMVAYQPNGTGSNSQTTQYDYGVGGTAGTNLFSNDLISEVQYPDTLTGGAGADPSDQVLYTYDLLGEPLSKKDQNQTTHSYSYDILGRLTLDSATTLGSGVDGSVRALGYTYSPLGLPYQQTSYSDAAGTTVVNQMQESYNGYGQLVGQYQAVSGAVNTTSTPVTQYTYSQPSGANYSRLTQMIYPNGRVLDYVYNSGLDSDISRVSALADDSGSGAGNLQSYTYLGLNTIVQQADANGVALSYIHQPNDTLSSSDGGDQYTGLDRFGRVIDQNYVNTSTGISTDRFQFAYDRDSNALYENNLLNSSFSELFHANSAASGDDSTAYDGLNRIVSFERGSLSASGNNGSTLDTVSSPTGFFSSQGWNYNSVGSITSDTGARYGNEARTANAQNELTQVKGTATLNPTYDSNGNMTSDGLGNTFIYDAWNRPVTGKQNGSVVYSYAYMANLNMGASTDTNNFTTTDFYYSADGREIEDRQGSAVTAQYVWGLGPIQNLVLRDDNSVSGSLGKTGSGLGERIFVQHDVNFNVTALTDASGNVLERWVYTPYGMSTVYSASWGSASDVYNWVYTFQMGRVEKYLGIKFGVRYYDPPLQVWDEADPAQYINGLDRYQFDLSNPINEVDPSGLASVITGFGGGPPTFTGGVTNPSGAGTGVTNVGTVSVYAGRTMTLNTGRQLPDAIIIEFKSSSPCTNCHWLQVLRRDRYTSSIFGPYLDNKNFFGYPKTITPAGSPPTTLGVPKVDNGNGGPLAPYYDQNGAHITTPGEVTIGDEPTVDTPRLDHYLVTVDDFLVCNGQLLYHLHWERWGSNLTSSGKAQYKNIWGTMPLSPGNPAGFVPPSYPPPWNRI